MKILSGGDIAKEVKGINPQFIAVGYIGKDWHRYIDIDFVKEIIVSPTIGSNPLAIKEIVDEIGFENVYFLDELHAKLYIGADRYAFGSFNLSASAFEEDRGLIEFGSITSDNIEQTKKFYEQCKNRAINSYPTIKEKVSTLESLFEKHKALYFDKNANAIALSQEETKEKNMKEHYDFYIFGVAGVAKFDINLIKANNERYKAIDDLAEKFENYNYICLNRETYADKVRINSWILEMNFDSDLPEEEKLSWIFVNSIAHSVNKDNESMLIQDDLSKIPTKPPFKIDSIITRNKIRSILNQEKYKPIFYDMSEDEQISEQFDFDVSIALSKEFKKDLLGH